MIILNNGSLTRKSWFVPETFQLMLGQTDSQATLTLGPEAPTVEIGDWMQDDTEPGKGIVWRVRSLDTDYNTDTRTVTLEHIIQTLKDTVLFGDVDTDTLGGGDAQAAVRYALGKQKIWTLGDFQYTLSAPFEFTSPTVMDVLEEVSSALADCIWEYDMTAMPFKIHIRKADTSATCEMRAGRNLSTIKKSVDKSRMYTRLYPIGANDLHLSDGYVQKNTELYGVICRVETDQAYETEEALRIWANDRLRRHCEPAVTVSISGLELSQETGESLDKLGINRLCRVPMPELGTTITEKITRLQWKDKQKDRMDVTVTMANNREDVATIFTREKQTTEKASRSGARGGAKLNNKIEDEAKGLYTQIIKTAEEIRLEAADTKKELQGSIDVQANKIGLLVEGTGKNAKIKPAAITAAINDSGDSSVVISASKISLDGTTRLNNIMTVTGGAVHISKPLMVDGSYADFNEIRIHGSRFAVTDSVGDKMVKTASADGNVLTLTLFDGTTIPFSKATTQSGKWSGGKYTVTAKQNSESVGTNVTQIKQLTQSGSVGKIEKYVGQNVSVYATENGGSNSVSTGFQQEVWIDASDVWQDGYDAGAGSGTSYRMYKGFNTNDSIYYGQLYNSAGVALTSSSYYWFGCATNLGGTNAYVDVKQ